MSVRQTTLTFLRHTQKGGCDMGKSLNGKELGKGISQRKDGRYEARFVDRFGKRRSVYGLTIGEVTKKLRDSEYENGNCLNSSDDSMTVDQWYKIWKETFKTEKCRDTTILAYERTYNSWISPEIGKLRISKVTPIHLQRIINKVGSKGSRGLVRSVLTNMFKYACTSEIVKKNVAQNLDIRRATDEDTEPVFLTDEELDIILKYSEGLTINYIFRLILQTGMRIGEITGLTWDNVDYDNNVIHVVQQLVTTKNPVTDKWEIAVHKPKSRSGIRDIPITTEARKIFQELRERNSVIIFPNKSDYVFLTKNNTPHFRATISKMSDILREKIRKDYPDFKNFSPHSFRHTFATKMIESGVKPKVLQKILGHNQLQTTMDLYCHVYDDQIQEAMSIYERGVKMA